MALIATHGSRAMAAGPANAPRLPRHSDDLLAVSVVQAQIGDQLTGDLGEVRVVVEDAAVHVAEQLE